MKPGPTLQCGPGLRFSVDLRTQTYTEPVPLKYGKLATKVGMPSCLIFVLSVWGSLPEIRRWWYGRPIIWQRLIIPCINRTFLVQCSTYTWRARRCFSVWSGWAASCRRPCQSDETSRDGDDDDDADDAASCVVLYQSDAAADTRSGHSPSSPRSDCIYTITAPTG